MSAEEESPKSWLRWALWLAAVLAIAFFSHGRGYETGYAKAIDEAPDLLAVREYQCAAQTAWYEKMMSEPSSREMACDSIFEIVREELIQDEMDAVEGASDALDGIER